MSIIKKSDVKNHLYTGSISKRHALDHKESPETSAVPSSEASAIHEDAINKADLEPAAPLPDSAMSGTHSGH